MKKRRLIALMCAGVIGLSMAGCSEQHLKEMYMSDEFECSTDFDLIQQDTNIIIDINGTATLHKGDVYAVEHPQSYGGPTLGFHVLEFDCGEKLNCTYPFSFGQNNPNQEHYDEVCEDCFNLNN